MNKSNEAVEGIIAFIGVILIIGFQLAMAVLPIALIVWLVLWAMGY